MSSSSPDWLSLTFRHILMNLLYAPKTSSEELLSSSVPCVPVDFPPLRQAHHDVETRTPCNSEKCRILMGLMRAVRAEEAATPGPGFTSWEREWKSSRAPKSNSVGPSRKCRAHCPKKKRMPLKAAGDCFSWPSFHFRNSCSMAAWIFLSSVMPKAKKTRETVFCLTLSCCSARSSSVVRFVSWASSSTISITSGCRPLRRLPAGASDAPVLPGEPRPRAPEAAKSSPEVSPPSAAAMAAIASERPK
mmetsp:Transcript_60267/g.179499  ORF Transcript_60267/g.179499 Transcript_60267/m.179499 type:complete len:247 (+) Transcript_60267:242-982(+)